MRLNLGCGNKRLPGWVNVDFVPETRPDQVWNLERLPWPWADNSVDEVLMEHVLEHLGAAPDVYIGIIKELHRVCRDGAKINVVVPHPRHDVFLADPTHVRPITPADLDMFSQRRNLELIQGGAATTPLGIYYNVDFDLVSTKQLLDSPWRERFARGELNEGEMIEAAVRYNNVVLEFDIVLRAIKPTTTERLRGAGTAG